jgi:hypothetical protein
VALVNQGGEGEAVAEHPRAAGQRRPDHFVEQLRARGLEKEGFREGREAVFAVFQQDRADRFPGGGSARVADEDGALPAPLQFLGQPPNLGGLAGAVRAFDYDKAPAAAWLPRSSWGRG